MLSFVKFKRAVLDAFEGEPVNAQVYRIQHRWFICAQSFDGLVSVSKSTSAPEVADEEAARQMAASTYAALLNEYASECTAPASD